MRTSIVIAGALAALGLGAGAARAEFTVHTVGSSCVPQPWSRGHVAYHARSGIENWSPTETAEVFCPISPWLGTYQSIYLNVYDRHPTQDVSCTAFAVDSEGGISWSQTRRSTNSSWSEQILVFTGMPSGGWITFSCSIPPMSNGAISHVITTGLNQR